MNKQKTGRKFGRMRGQRKAFVQGLAHNLIVREKITTTEARAKEIRPVVEKAVTMAKKQTLASLRLLQARFPKPAAEKLYYDLGLRYKGRNGGYLRIVKQGVARKRDGAPVARIEFVESK
jgi:large subunit ribosomal protein L17